MAERKGATGCVCQDQHRRGYCTEPGCSYSQGETGAEQRSAGATEPLAEFFRWAMENGPFDGCELDGGDVQEKAAALGLIEPAKAQDDWWVYTEAARGRSPAATELVDIAELIREVQPCTAERPTESPYQHGKFIGVMETLDNLRKALAGCEVRRLTVASTQRETEA